MRVIFPDKHNKNPFLTQVLRQLPSFILITSCISPLLSYLMKRLFGIPGIIETLALSTAGIHKHNFWQFITYPLITADSLCIHKEGCMDITQRLLVRNVLGFTFFYKATNHIIRKLGSITFLILVTSQVLITGVAVWACLKLFHSSQALFGPECLISTLLLIWVFLDPEKRLGLHPFPITLSRKWGFVVLAAFYFLMLLFSGAFALFFGSIFSLMLGVLFCYKEKIPNPYRTSRIF
ncbi:hypothetical protein CP09DC78_0141 [Chlamydia psittaci 09DC78]|uniref:hypothetical protein n=1 Tax=Chlamydia psittaci TaxID=83554 RepID=UPI00035482E6|nr:hypothetical protein [Chlamydia psittaci]EPJ25626.1 hypothetical protein CP09DC77_0143 [Chlamydia psittaci 09DC77]EPJ27303.1 hypothetical protein CP09DC80_0142 [Chlamydia psittaci 09DC80]EPJ30821.1 hypothetical protein CP09DC78_0141 [Chlamydia psittaci 09DC78]EPL00784.1 hypothetical protein CP09DC79_0946 [Chlamydia psittaci 09DC79]